MTASNAPLEADTSTGKKPILKPFCNKECLALRLVVVYTAP